MALTLPGCGTIVDAAAGVFGPSGVAGAVDAFVVYRLRPDCPDLLARSLDSGYAVLAPRSAPVTVPLAPAFTGDAVEATGVFEGPVRDGEVVFRYVPPAASETWTAGPIDVVADVAAVRLTQAEGSALLVERCGPDPAEALPPSPTDSIPRRLAP